MKQQNKIRIIAGKWKRRMLPVHNAPDLRPSPDAVRETLFNWLQWDIEQATCLDLFAGSGALGFEAASRGAKAVTLVEKHAPISRQLQQNCATLNADNIDIIRTDAMVFLKSCKLQYDIIFLDPPFASDFLAKALSLIETQQCLRENGKIYIERKKSDMPLPLPANWHIIRHTTCGLVQSYLIATKNTDQT